MLALLLGACGDLPQPFRHEGSNEALRPQAARAVVVVAPDGGAALAEAIVRHLLDSEIPASTRPLDGDAAWTFAGRIEREGALIVLRWRLSRAEIPPVELTRTLPAAAWQAATPALTDGLAADLVASLLPALAPVAAAPAVPPPPTLRLIPPAGLPGDGNRALAEALRRRLSGSGLTLVEGDAPAELEARVQAAVVPQPGGDALTLVWRVTDRAGAELGQATQRGAVPHGRLDAAWGSLADDIAAGGAEGLFAILRGTAR